MITVLALLTIEFVLAHRPDLDRMSGYVLAIFWGAIWDSLIVAAIIKWLKT